jgi:hypothetical protein
MVPTFRTIVLDSVCSTWHPAYDLGHVPSSLAFLVYERLHARGAADGSRPVTCSELYPFVRSHWQLRSLDLTDCREWLVDHSLGALNYVLTLSMFTLIGALQVSDAGMAFLGRQRSLVEVDVSWCAGLSDSFLAHLMHLKATLRSLNVTGLPRITDAGVGAVIQLVGLQRLGLGSTSVTDQALDYITYYSRYPSPGQPGLQHLEWLSLAGTRITDTGLGKLCATQGGVVFKKLRLLGLSSTSGVGGRAVNDVRLKYGLIAPLPNAPRTLASTNRDAMLGEAWQTRTAPADDRKQLAGRLLDGRPVEASWLEDGIRRYMRQFMREMMAQPGVAAPAEIGGGATASAPVARGGDNKRKHGTA